MSSQWKDESPKESKVEQEWERLLGAGRKKIIVRKQWRKVKVCSLLNRVTNVVIRDDLAVSVTDGTATY